MSSVVEAVTSWPAAIAFAVICMSSVLIATVAFKSKGKSRVRIFGRVIDIEFDSKPDDQIEHDGKPDDQIEHDGKPDDQIEHDGKPDDKTGTNV